MEEKKKKYKTTRLREFEQVAKIGEGSYGIVYLAQHQLTRKYYALKVLPKAELIKYGQVEHTRSECELLSTLVHPFIVNLHGIDQDQRHLYLVMEFVQGGEFFTYLRYREKLPLHEARFYAAQVVLVLEFLHERDIIFRDLKPENILLGRTGYIKLIDFGFAKHCTDRTYTLCGTPEYLAPEIILNKGHGKSVDWWAFGVLLYEMLIGIDPFSDEEPDQVYKNILGGKLSFPIDFDPDAKNLIRRILIEDLSKRLGNLKKGALDIKEHSFFKDTKWEDILSCSEKPPYTPVFKSEIDLSNFTCSDELPSKKNSIIKAADDPFINWQH